MYGEDVIKLASGYKFYTNRGIIGISPELAVYQGYDNGICPPGGDGSNFTNDELLEIAEIAISRWKRFQEAVKHRNSYGK